MLTWGEIRAELTAIGFLNCYVELECAKHGAHRIGFLADSEFRPACPKCGTMCDRGRPGARPFTKTNGLDVRQPRIASQYKAHREDPIIVLRCKQNTRRKRPEFLGEPARAAGSSAHVDDSDTRAGARAATSTSQSSRNPGRDAETNCPAQRIATSARVAGSNFENTRDRMAAPEGYNLPAAGRDSERYEDVTGSGSHPVKRDYGRSANCCEKYDP